eukprot:COSAG02_NODE_20928_length_809_cov_1.602817_1_plen_201_part_10
MAGRRLSAASGICVAAVAAALCPLQARGLAQQAETPHEASFVAGKTVDDSFSVHVPLYDPRLSPKSPEISKLLWAAKHVPLSVAMCGSFHGCAAIGQCCHAEENEQAAKLLRAAGVTVLHYVPTMQLPTTASPKCCNSMANISQMVSAALANNASDGIYFDVVAGLNELGDLPFFRALHGLVQNHRPKRAPRPVMFNPSTP